jgi:uncharacterized membrane protein
MSLLGINFDIQGYIFKPFYLLLGALYFIVLLSLLATLYVVLYLRNTLEIVLKDIEKNRKKYNRLK